MSVLFWFEILPNVNSDALRVSIFEISISNFSQKRNLHRWMIFMINSEKLELEIWGCGIPPKSVVVKKLFHNI